jgi:hypothetical protein
VSLRPDISNDPKVWNPSKWPPIWVGALSSTVYNQYVKEYTQALHVP